jgi:glycosyltransferase involved in cell wall biosynthesis
MKSKFFFSIVIVNFNGGKYIEESIISVLNQKEKDFELIIIDGGSNDNSLSIIQKYLDRLSWWVSEPDLGQSDALNKGFSKATGKYFCWINSDDILLPNSLEIAKKYIYKYPDYHWFAANTIFFDFEGRIIRCSRGLDWKGFLFKFLPVNVGGPTSIFHRNIFDAVGKFDVSLIYTMDTNLWMRIKDAGFNFKRVHKYFWGFRIHEQSKTSHAYFGNPKIEFKLEQDKMSNINNAKYAKYFLILHYFFKILSVSFWLSLCDTIRLRGQKISSLYEK